MGGKTVLGFTLIDVLVAMVLISVVFFSSVFFLSYVKGERREAESVAVAYKLITKARTLSLSKGTVCFVKLDGENAYLSCTDGYKESATLLVPVSKSVTIAYKNGVVSEPVTVKIGDTCIYVELSAVNLKSCKSGGV